MSKKRENGQTGSEEVLEEVEGVAGTVDAEETLDVDNVVKPKRDRIGSGTKDKGLSGMAAVVVVSLGRSGFGAGRIAFGVGVAAETTELGQS